MCFLTPEIAIAVNEIPANKKWQLGAVYFKPSRSPIACLSKYNPPSYHFL